MKNSLIVLISLALIDFTLAQWVWQNPLPQGKFNSVYFTNDDTGFVAGLNGVMLKTTNSGGRMGAVRILRQVGLWLIFPE
ncbi:MAG: hypothetical protein U5J96_17115 [Ignavibacteriaceae bacterium]|nr:hypothetical protein [Ignavibacteriaceae bacterium]